MPSAESLDKATLQSNAKLRLEDAQVLYDHQRYDGAAYIGGYAVEFALKARICETLNTTIYPGTLSSFKTHNLDTLLILTGQESHIKSNVFEAWNFIVGNWQPEMRYKPAGAISTEKVKTLLAHIATLLRHL